MAFTNSGLVVHKNLSPNYSQRRSKVIDTITPHVVVGHTSLQNLGAWFARPSAGCASNYGIDDKGKVALFVEEKNRAWTSGGSDANGNPIRVNGISGADNDHRAVTIEIASDAKAPYAITDGAMDGLILLCADICKRNGIPKLLWKADKSLVGNIAKQNMTVHRWFSYKSCPGDYVYARLGEVADEVNKILIPSIAIPTNPIKPVSPASYLVKITASVLNYRKGPGTNYGIAGQIREGEVYTIVEEKTGVGASKWGRLKSGAGWISLDYAVKIK